MQNPNHELETSIQSPITFAYSLVSKSSDGVTFCNLSTINTVTTDSNFLKLIGLNSNTVTSKSLNWEDFLYIDSLALIKQHIQKAQLNKNHTFKEELKIYNQNKDLVWVSCTGFIVETPEKLTNTLLIAYNDITKYKKTENKQALRINRFEQVIDGAYFGSWEHNIETEEVILNNRWAEIIGYSLEDLGVITTETWKKYTHPDDCKIAEQLFEDHISGKTDFYACQFRMKHRNGNWVWVFSRGKVTSYSLDGKAKWIAGSHYDITNIKQNEIELNHQKKLLEEVNEIAKIGAWEYNIKTNTFYWCSTIKKIIEIDDDYEPSIPGLSEFIINEEDETIRKENMANTFKTGKPFKHTLQIKTKKGNVLWVNIIGKLKYTDDDPVTIYGFLQDINEQVTVNENLSQKEEQFKRIFKYAHNGMCLVGLEGNFLNVNTSLCKMLGYTSKEIKKLKYQDVTHPDYLEKDLQCVQDILNNKIESYQLEKKYIRKDGSVMFGLLSVTIVKDNDGNPMYFISQINDITERKNNESLLKHNSHLLESVNEAAQIGIWEYDLNKDEVYWSDTIKKLMGVPPNYEPNLDDAISIFKEGKDRTKISNLVSNAITKGINYDVNLQVNTKHKGVKWARTIGISEYKNGKCQKLYGFFQDIDAIKKAELQIKLKEEQFRTTFKHSKTGMAIISSNGKIQMANPSLCSMLKYSETELKEMSIYNITFDKDLAFTSEFLESLTSGKIDGKNFDKRYITKNGSIIWANATVAAVKNDKGEFTHVVAQLIDVTENKLLNESLKEHNKRLVDFSHIVSHNLRSHTSNINMLLDIGKDKNPDLIDNEIFQHMETAANNMSETVNYLSEIVEINTKLDEKLIAVNLQPYVLKAIENFKSSLKDINCIPTISVDENLKVLVIPEYLENSILNIINNAIKYRNPNKAAIINITSDTLEKYVSLSITDNGYGIDLEKHGDKLFGMYKTFHEHKDAKGIGLFICKNQIEAIGGKIEVKSDVNKGSTFTIYLKHEHNY
ncbi:PAS domain S-box protein [Bizionia sp. KMM 8389]